LSAALAVCALVVGGVLLVLRPHQSRGLRVYIALPNEGIYEGPCGDNDGLVVLQVRRDGQVQVNGGPTTNQIKAMVKARYEEGLFVMPDPDVDFGKVAAAIDMASDQVERIALLTPLVKGSAKCRPWFPSPTPQNPLDRYVKSVSLWPY
jgi:biopolymer transport protein ExbD